MSGVDLGVYRVCVTLTQGLRFTSDWQTGPHGPLDRPFPPAWKNEEELLETIAFYYLEGNGSCDCNKALELARAKGDESDPDRACGDTMPTMKIEVTAPDGRVLVIFEEQ